MDGPTLGGDGETRWGRIAIFMFVLTILFVAFTIEEALEGNGPKELVTTALPTLICGGLWRYAVSRRDR